MVEERATREFLAPLPCSLLRTRPELQALPEILEQLGIRTLGELAALPSRALAERFGHPGLLALDLARGATRSSSRGGLPSRSASGSTCRMQPPGSSSSVLWSCSWPGCSAGASDRGVAQGLAMSARFVAGGTWRLAVTLRRASADPARIRLVLAPRLAELPAPAESLALEVEAFGPPAHDQGQLLDEAGAVRRARLGEAVRQARQAAGPDAALRVLDVDPDSRIPERRTVLAPFPDWQAP